MSLKCLSQLQLPLMHAVCVVRTNESAYANPDESVLAKLILVYEGPLRRRQLC